jgi:gamma-glutamyltranspeptidase/glutathione hydrolase
MKIYRPLFLILFILSGCHNIPEKGDSEIIEGRHISAKHGMVVSAHPEGSRVGVSILMEGGNAVDAAVATGFALAVCYPEAGNIGGGGFMVIRKSDGEADVIDFREKAPLKASRDMYLDDEGNVIWGLSTETHLATGVPGAVDGLIKAHSEYGRLSFKKVIQPAIDLARKGFPLNEEQASSFNRNREYFLKKNIKRPAFVSEKEWKEGDILIQPDLAQTLERIRDNGRDGFYAGTTADLIVMEMERGGGLITHEDLAGYKSVSRKPLITSYKNYKLISVPLPSGGGLILFQLLGMIETFPINEWGFHSTEAVHLITEAEKRVYADRAEFSGDQDFVNVPVNDLLNKTYLEQRLSDLDMNAATPSSAIRAGSPGGYHGEETTHYSIADNFGNAVSVTTTLNNTFGNSIVVDGAGFLLNNEMNDFSIKPGVPNMFGLTGGEANSIEPGKRMLSSMTPVIVEKDRILFMVAGSPGGSTIPTSVFQVIINVIEYNMSIGEAVDTGRFHHQWLPDYISYEKNSLDTLVLSKLRNMGHETRERVSIGQVNAIQVSSDGLLISGADKRSYNTACGH